MKKLLGFSVIAMMAAAPAFAAPVAGAPDHIGNETTAASVTANVEPEFALVEANSATDGNAASAGYVKGAYNAAIKAINKVNANTKTEAGDGLTKSGNTISVDLATNSGLEVDNGKLKVDAADGSIALSAAGASVALTENKGLTKGTNGTLEVKAGNGVALDSTGVKVVAGDGIAVDGNGVAVDLTSDKGLVIDGTTKKLEIKDGAGIKTGSNGVEVDLKTKGGLTTDTNGQMEVVVDGSTVEVDATDGTIQVKDGGITVAKIATSDIAAGTGTYAGSTDLANQGYVDQAIAGLSIGDYATKAGVDKTIKATTIDITDGKTVSTSLSGKDGITATTTLTIMDNWAADTGTQTTTLATTSVNASSLGVSSTLGGSITAAVNANSVSYATANAPAQQGE